jgi:hypothetical protein
LNHKNIVKLYKICEKSVMVMDNLEKKPCSYLVYELMPKGSLDKKI